MHQPSIAVLIPTYNAGRYLGRALESVLNQNYSPMEIIVVNDGSTDDTITILRDYSPYIRVLSHPNNENRGQAASLNSAIQQSNSSLIAFLDSDDLFYPNKLAEQARIFAEYPKVGLVFTNGHVIDEHDNILWEISPDGFGQLDRPNSILQSCYIRTPSLVMVRRSIFEQTGLFRRHLHASDHDMWVRVGEVTEFYYMPKCLAAWRQRPGQVSSKRILWEDGFIILKDACARYPYGTHVKRKRLAVLHYRLGQYDWNHNFHWRAFMHFLLAGIFDAARSIEFACSSLSRARKS